MDAPETSELLAFVQIADAGSISGAASELELPRATVSRRLARLEDRLGVKLMHRTTRQLQLTESGEELYHHARSIVQAVESASRAVRRSDDTPRGLLRVSAPPLSLGFRKVVLSFVERYPEVQLELISSSRHEDMIANNIDLAWRAGVSIDPGLIARRLVASEVVGLASPAYLERAGVPETPADLERHACLVGFARGVRPATHWPLHDGGKIRVRGRLVSNDVVLLLDAARRDMGIAVLPAIVAGLALERGEVVPVLPGVLGTASQVALVYPDKRLLKPAVRAFVDHVVESLKDESVWSMREP